MRIQSQQIGQPEVKGLPGAPARVTAMRFIFFIVWKTSGEELGSFSQKLRCNIEISVACELT
ncbi:hypothetical protein [Pantoea sp. MQR6]|uniref:hypothetical protein n=1 Tax=Pantoea sp. MQR6 TaxID=2907307 RepID=UPI001FAA8334|nr:hypothetical protein [Pantoea sp. MQR6]